MCQVTTSAWLLFIELLVSSLAIKPVKQKHTDKLRAIDVLFQIKLRHSNDSSYKINMAINLAQADSTDSSHPKIQHH